MQYIMADFISSFGFFKNIPSSMQDHTFEDLICQFIDYNNKYPTRRTFP